MTESRSLSVINAAISAPFVHSVDCNDDNDENQCADQEMVAISLTT